MSIYGKGLSGGSGGNGPTKNIWVYCSSTEATQQAVMYATKNSVVIYPTYNEIFNRSKFELPLNNSVGTWTITAEFKSVTKTTTIEITQNTNDYYFTFDFVPLVGTLEVGNSVTYDDVEYIVVHNSGTDWYLGAAQSLYEGIVWNASDRVSYANSNVYARMVEIKENMSDAALFYMKNVTISSVSDKVFTPTYAQLNGGFTYFTDNTRRLYKDAAGNKKYYWTSSTYPSAGYLYMVSTDGSFTKGWYSGGGVTTRHFICLDHTLFP